MERIWTTDSGVQFSTETADSKQIWVRVSADDEWVPVSLAEFRRLVNDMLHSWEMNRIGVNSV